MNFLRQRSSAARNNEYNRLSYLHGPDQSYSSEYVSTMVDPRRNLNELFDSICEERVRMENLRVYLRVRPSLPGEVQQDEDTKVDLLDDRSVTLTAPACSNTFKNSVRGITKLCHKFTFTHVYGPATTQEELFNSSTHGLVSDFISGQNCLLFTYGATNSGKTFTVQGTTGDAGLLPRTLQHIFTTVGERQYPRNDLKPKFSFNVTQLEEQDALKEEEKRESIFRITSNLTTTFSQSSMSIFKSSVSGCDDTLNSTEHLTEYSAISHNTTEAGDNEARHSTATTTSSQCPASPESAIYAIFVSFAEIYNEYIFDLLERIPSSKTGRRNALMLGEDRSGAIYIKGLNEVRVRNAEEALQLLDIGRQNLHFAATRLNHNSSRSHCIFTIKLIRLADADCPHYAHVSVLSLCDLAGAERAAKTLSSQDRLKESGNINTSLLTLSRCIEALRNNQTQKGSRKVPVPYRDSKLTRLFQSFLLGRGKAAMIVNISKMPLLFDETLQVLKFSAIAKQVAISQVKDPEVAVVQPSRRMSRLSKMVRQSLKSNGRLSVPWAKAAANLTFGESVSEENEAKGEALENNLHEQDEDEENSEDEDDRIELLLEQIVRLKDELVREHQEKQDLEERLRRELCKEFSQQLVEIQNSWRQRLKDQENRYEEYTECKIQALMQSVKKCNKRRRSEEDPDEEYVPSIFLFQEQRKVEEQNQEIEELKADKKLLEDEVKTMKESQRKMGEQATKAQEEAARLTFRLAQLTSNYDKLSQELEAAHSLNKATASNNDEAARELRDQLEARNAQLAKRDQEIQELNQMLLEASECYTEKEERCAALENICKSSQYASTQQLVYISELERKLEEASSTLSQQAAQMEEREQESDELRQMLSNEKNNTEKELEVKRKELEEMKEDHIREKSKLLLEMAGLKRSHPLEAGGNAEELKTLKEKVAQLEEEKEALRKSEQTIKEKWDTEGTYSAHKAELEELKEAHMSLTCKHEALQSKVEEQIETMNKVKCEAEARIKEKEEEAVKQASMCAELRAEVEELRKINESQRETAREASEVKEATVKLEAELKQMTVEKSELQAHVEMLEKEKVNGEKLYSLLEASHLRVEKAEAEMQAMEERNKALTREKEELEDKVKTSIKLSQEQASLVTDKQGVIMALSNKVKSLDAKLDKADEDLSTKYLLEKELEGVREEASRLQAKCEVHQKEIRALREARQAEVLESSNRTKEHEDFARQKDAEISTLQQEVKRLLQLSMTSSMAEAPPALPPEGNDSLQVIREQLRLTLEHNSTLMQEVNTLRSRAQVSQSHSSTADSSALHLSASKASQKKQKEAHTTKESEAFVSPELKERGRGRKARQTSHTPNPESSRSRHASPSPSSPRPAPTSSSGRPQRTTRRTMRYDSQEYELAYKVKEDEGDSWEPGHVTAKSTCRTTRGRGRKKTNVSEIPPFRPSLHDQENSSSMANKADVYPELESEPEQDGRKKTTAPRRRRVLFDPEDVQEPLICTPDKAAMTVQQDSPLTMVRRQLRTKRK